MKLKSRKASKSTSASKFDCSSNGNYYGGDIQWELRPGGMLVQKRNNGSRRNGDGIITVRVSTAFQLHDISIQATSTFGEMKMILALVTSLEPREQRLLFRGKEREDSDHLHMVGVKDMDKVILLEDPAYRERKLLAYSKNSKVIGQQSRIIRV